MEFHYQNSVLQFYHSSLQVLFASQCYNQYCSFPVTELLSVKTLQNFTVVLTSSKGAMAQSVVQMDDCPVIKMEDGFVEIARPHIFQNGAMILNGDEDNQVAVYEGGKVTDWAVNLLKWRFFSMPPTTNHILDWRQRFPLKEAACQSSIHSQRPIRNLVESLRIDIQEM